MIGQTLATRYHIIRDLARGGFGRTFVAEDLQRPGHPQCLVKQFQPTGPDPQKVARKLFDREAEILERLGNHDQIPRLLAHFEENQEFFLVEEFIEGRDITKELTANNPWRESEAIELLEAILEVLAFVHQQGVIHRDIKPDNLIRRAWDNKIVLIDFGAVKEIRTMHGHSQRAATIIGTNGYMPGEQINGNPQLASDIYAVGMVAIQALTGIWPHELPKDPQTSEAIWRARVQVSDRLWQVLDKMVRWDFRMRYPSATEALAAVKELKNPIASTVISPTPPQSPLSGLWTKSNMIILAVFVGIVSCLAVVIKIPEVREGLGPDESPIQSQMPEKPQIPQIPQTSDLEEKFQEYDNDDYRFTIKYPQDWSREDVEDPLTGTVVIFVNHRDVEGVPAKVILLVEELNKAMSLGEYTDSSIAEINQFLKQAEVLKNSNTTLGNRRAYKLLYRGRDGEKALQKLEVGMMKHDRVYVITYEAEGGEYAKFEQTAQKMIDSFELWE